MGDVEHSVALGDDDGVEVHIAPAETLLNVNSVGRLVEQVLSGFQRAAAAKIVPEDEGFFATDQAGALQFGGDAARGVSGVEHYKCLAGWFDRGEDGPGKPTACADERNQN